MYASRTLSETETRYAQIEKEMLAIIYAVEKFNDYTFGRKVTVYSDHTPLESILKKPLHRAPKRLQGMMIRLQKYDIVVKYEIGSNMFLADTLSRASIPGDEKSGPEFETINMMKYLPISDERLKEIQRETKNDESLQVRGGSRGSQMSHATTVKKSHVKKFWVKVFKLNYFPSQESI